MRLNERSKRLTQNCFSLIFATAAACVLVMAGCKPQSHGSSASFSSGGLGLSRSQWERLHANPFSEDSAYVTYNAPYDGAFRLNFGHSNCFFLGRYYHSTVVPLDVARDEARKLIPIGSSLTRTYIGGTYNSAVVDLYRSQSIISRFPDDPDDRLGGEPGDFTIAYYKSGDGEVEEVVIQIGNNP